MRALDRWFQDQAARQHGRVSLEDAVLADRFCAYAFYRLRFFLGRTLLDVVVHFVEFYFLVLIFDGRQLSAAVMIRAIESLVSGWWWGGLEVMRDQVRTLQRQKRSNHIPIVFARWMATARRYAILAIALTVGWVVFDVARSSQQFSVFHLFVLSGGVRLALGLLSRTYHSGVFATNRVYRPFGAVIAIDLLGAAGTALLWPFLAEYSFPLVSLLAAFSASGLTFIYVGRMYEFLGIGPIGSAVRGARRANVKETFGADFLVAGLANAVTSLDGLLIFFLACTSNQLADQAHVFFLFYLIAPLLRASHDWARLFYFDLKRLELDLFANVRQRFTGQVLSIAAGVGGLLWLLSSLCGTIALGKNLGWLYLGLAALFAVRALLAFYQVQAFSQKRYGTLFFSGLFVLGAVLVSCSASPSGLARTGTLAAGLLPVVACLKLASTRSSCTAGPTDLLSPSVWLARVVAVNEPVKVRTVRVSREVAGVRAEQFALEIARRVSPASSVSLLSGGHIGWFEGEDSQRSPDNSWLLSRGAGLVESIYETPLASCGLDALRTAHDATEFLGTVKTCQLGTPGAPTCESILKRFRETCPEGVYWDAATRSSGA